MKIRASVLGFVLLSGCVGIAPPPPNASGAAIDLTDDVDGDAAGHEHSTNSLIPGGTPRPCMPGPTGDIAGPVPCPPGPTGDGTGSLELH